MYILKYLIRKLKAKKNRKYIQDNCYLKSCKSSEEFYQLMESKNLGELAEQERTIIVKNLNVKLSKIGRSTVEHECEADFYMDEYEEDGISVGLVAEVFDPSVITSVKNAQASTPLEYIVSIDADEAMIGVFRDGLIVTCAEDPVGYAKLAKFELSALKCEE